MIENYFKRVNACNTSHGGHLNDDELYNRAFSPVNHHQTILGFKIVVEKNILYVFFYVYFWNHEMDNPILTEQMLIKFCLKKIKKSVIYSRNGNFSFIFSLCAKIFLTNCIWRLLMNDSIQFDLIKLMLIISSTQFKFKR